LKKYSENNTFQVEQQIDKKGVIYRLYTILKSGQKVLFYENSPKELQELSLTDISNRLYKVIKFEKDGRIVFGHHLSSLSDKQLRELAEEFGKSIYNGFSSVNFSKPWPKLKLSVGNLNILIEGKDFIIEMDGSIKFSNQL
jgi:CRISPR-associated endonuclease Csn1